MLKRVNRLSNSREIKRLYQKGQSATSSLFRIFWQLNRFDQPRATIVIGAKFSKKAVKRNLIKRRIRAVVGSNLNQLKAIDLVVQTKLKPIDLFSFASINNDLLQLLKKNNLIR